MKLYLIILGINQKYFVLKKEKHLHQTEKPKIKLSQTKKKLTIFKNSLLVEKRYNRATKSSD